MFLAVMNILSELALRVFLFKSHAKINQMTENLCQGVVSFNYLTVMAKQPLPASLSILNRIYLKVTYILLVL